MWHLDFEGQGEKCVGVKSGFGERAQTLDQSIERLLDLQKYACRFVMHEFNR